MIRPGSTGVPLLKLRWIIVLLSLWQCSAAAAEGKDAAPDSVETRMLACTACHGPAGQGSSDDFIPRLAGKPAGYLYNQLAAFRSGRRRYSPMNYLLEFQSDAYLHAMADYFSRQHPPLLSTDASPGTAEAIARGRVLATQGDTAHAIPACQGCHNPAFTGMEPGIPALAGLRPSYISAQLGAWRYGTRTAPPPDCMQMVASRLTEADVTALAAYLSTLPAPTDALPVPHGSLPMPLVCGSEPN